MENATKALLISAAVLVAIVLIAVGMRILGSTKGVTDSVGDLSTATGVSVYNSKLTQYQGTRKGSEVKALLRTVRQFNNGKEGENFIKVSFTGVHDYNNAEDDQALQDMLDVTQASGTYNVNMTANEQGYINQIKITY